MREGGILSWMIFNIFFILTNLIYSDVIQLYCPLVGQLLQNLDRPIDSNILSHSALSAFCP